MAPSRRCYLILAINEMKKLTARQKKALTAQRGAFGAWLEAATPEQLAEASEVRATRSFGLPINEAAKMLEKARRRANA